MALALCGLLDALGVFRFVLVLTNGPHVATRVHTKTGTFPIERIPSCGQVGFLERYQ